nr:hypothetical protein [Rickettsia endosymbiont of Oedothorax gibbosus]
MLLNNSLYYTSLAGLLAYVFKPNKISVAFGKLNNLNLPLTSN